MAQKRSFKILNRALAVGLFILLSASLAACSLVPISASESARQTEIRATELDINVKQTLLAQQQVDRSIELTAQAGTATAMALTPHPPTAAPTATAPPAETPTVQIIENLPQVTPSPAPVDEQAFKTWMKSAKILLYEDMTARLDTVRYVKLSLDDMGLSYKNDGSAYGWLLDDLKNGPGEGEQWDLIIIAAEDKAGVQADFFSMILNAVDQGTSAILEVWYLNNTYSGSASGLLSHCEIEYENNWIRIPPSRAALFVLSPDNPILQQPNSHLSFTSSTSFWWDPNGQITYDVGDLVKLSPGSHATLLLGTAGNSNTSHGTSTVCMDGKLILQTFSSHVLTFNTMEPLWQNYIYNALLTRFTSLQ